MAEFMRSSDAFSWSMERDPGLRSTIVTLVLLDRSPDWGQIVERFDRLCRTLPMFRQKVVSSPAPAPPRWEIDSDFDLGFHMRRVTAPEPGTVDTVLEMARHAAMADFDRARPLWEATLIDGLADGGAALLCKVNHALTDGVGGVQIAMTLYDLSEVGEERGPMPAQAEATAHRPLYGFGNVLRYEAGLVGAALTDALQAAPRLIVNGVRRPGTAVAAAGATAASVYRTVRPISAPGSPIMRNRKLIRRLGIHEVPKPTLRMAGHIAGGSLNDAFVAALTGGLRRYHDNHGVTVGDLHMTMPISIRTAADAIGGNRVTLMRFDVPVAAADPAQRIRIIHQQAGKARNERSLRYTDIIAGALNLMPRWYVAAALRNVDFVASDVPGIPVPVFLGGASVRMQYAFPRRSGRL